MKGIILAGGLGRRMMPFTRWAHKVVLPVYDKPVIYFPINTLKQAGIEDIVICTNVPEQIQAVLSEEELKVNLTYVLEPNPGSGNGRALYAAKERIRDQPVLLILGDIYLGSGIRLPTDTENATVYVSPSLTPESGVVEISPTGGVLSFEEKPTKPKGKHVHIGVTFYPKDLIDLIESEDLKDATLVTDVSNAFVRSGRLNAIIYSGLWFNINTPEDLYKVAEYRRTDVRGL